MTAIARTTILAILGLVPVAAASAQTVAIGNANMFKCPEAIRSEETKVWALAAWNRYTLDRNPRAGDPKVMIALRRQFLVAHRCTKTLRNMGSGN